MIKIFNLFKRKNDVENEEKNVERSDGQSQVSTILEDAKNSLKEIEAVFCHIKDASLFSNLLSFIAYYFLIIEFYKQNAERIISVNELLLFKYIDMIKDLLNCFYENKVTKEQKEELIKTLSSINDKLYDTIKNMKEQQELDLNVDLKTIQDLIRSDF